MLDPLKKCPQYVQRMNKIVLRSDEYPKPKDNAQKCFKKLDQLLDGIAKDIIAKEALAVGPPGLTELQL